MIKNWRFVTFAASVIVLLALGVLWNSWGSPEETVKLDGFSHEQGFSYIGQPQIQSRTVSLLGLALKIRYKLRSGDSSDSPNRSTVQLFENGRALGPAHSLHDDIRNIGRGKFSHWGGVLYFSASDNSDPRTNGKIYTAKARLTVKGGLKKVLNFVAIIAVAGLVLSLQAVLAWFVAAVIATLPLMSIALWMFLVVLFLHWNRVPIGFSVLGILIHSLLIFLLLLTFAVTQFLMIRSAPPNRLTRAFFKGVGWGLCLIILLLSGEVLCRIIPLPDTLAINPGVRHFWPDWVEHPLNQAGYREKSFIEKKSDYVFRIFVVGDSYVEGAGLRRDQTAGSSLEQELNRRLKLRGSSHRAEVFNLGHCGDNTVQAFARMKEMVPRYRPDLVVMTYVLNDAEETGLTLIDQRTSPVRAWLDRHLMGCDGSYLWYRYSDWERRWLSRLRPAGKYTNYIEDIHREDAPGWIAGQKAFGGMKAYFKSQNIDWFYVIWPLFTSGPVHPSTRELHDKILKAMTQQGVEAYDLLPYFLSREPDLGKLSFSYRDSHPNENAHKLLSGFLADNIFGRKSFEEFQGNAGLKQKEASAPIEATLDS